MKEPKESGVSNFTDHTFTNGEECTFLKTAKKAEETADKETAKCVVRVAPVVIPPSFQFLKCREGVRLTDSISSHCIYVPLEDLLVLRGYSYVGVTSKELQYHIAKALKFQQSITENMNDICVIHDGKVLQNRMILKIPGHYFYARKSIESSAVFREHFPLTVKEQKELERRACYGMSSLAANWYWKGVELADYQEFKMRELLAGNTEFSKGASKKKHVEDLEKRWEDWVLEQLTTSACKWNEFGLHAEPNSCLYLTNVETRLTFNVTFDNKDSAMVCGNDLIMSIANHHLIDAREVDSIYSSECAWIGGRDLVPSSGKYYYFLNMFIASC